MKEANPILEMSYRFALDVTAAARIMRERKEYDLASQFWRSGTSIGANVEEAQAAQAMNPNRNADVPVGNQNPNFE